MVFRTIEQMERGLRERPAVAAQHLLASPSSSPRRPNGEAATYHPAPWRACSSTGRCRTRSRTSTSQSTRMSWATSSTRSAHYRKADIAQGLDYIKNLCFRYARTPGYRVDRRRQDARPRRPRSSTGTRRKPRRSRPSSVEGIITDGERRQKEVEIWTDATDEVRVAMERSPQGGAVQPHRHDGGLGCSREHDAGPPDRGHARPGGQPSWRHDPPPDQVELP